MSARVDRLRGMLAEYEAADCAEFPAWLSTLGQEDVKMAIAMEERKEESLKEAKV